MLSLCRVAEVQDSHRGSAASQTHGLPRWRCAGGHHEGQGLVLDDESGVRRTGVEGARKAGSLS